MPTISTDVPFIRFVSLGGPGIACGIEGVTLGPAHLVMANRTDGKPLYSVATPEEVAEAFALAFATKSPLELARRFLSLARIADCLNRGDLPRAMTLALLMRLPDISDAGMAKLHSADTLSKYAPDQPRVPAGNPDGGQWTSDPNSSVAQAIPLPLEGPMPLSPPRVIPIPQEILPPPLYPLVPHNPYPDDPDCVREWAYAEAFCQDQLNQNNLQRNRKARDTLVSATVTKNA